MVGLIVLREESGTDQKQLGTEWILGLVAGESTLAPSRLAREGQAIGSAKSIGSIYARSYPQLVHRSDPELSTIALWTVTFVILFRPKS